jgi:2-polyprenyl-3-methyl-5-hydroxy-6-metoxy-1,4-benzoquinol methylase
VSERHDHYSYTVYADPATARTFDERRFGGPIGELIASDQARVLTEFLGRVEGRSILDVGTGTGRAALLMAANGAIVTGLDASEQMLSIARERACAEHADVRFLRGDAHALEFPDRSFDMAVSLRMLMHTPRWHACLDELCRVAQHLVVIDYPSAHSAAALQALGRRLLHAVGRSTEPYRVFFDDEIADAFLENGFRIRSVHRQFVLPIALHKAIGSRSFTQASEGAFNRVGLMKVFGSPVTIVAERCAIS